MYVAMTQAQRRQLVHCPWLSEQPPGPTVRDLGRETAQAICSPFGSPDGRTFPDLGDLATPSPSEGHLLRRIRELLPDHQSTP